MPKPLLAAFAVFLLAIGAVFGFMIGGNKAQPRWYDTPAHVSFESKVASFKGSGDWTFGVRDSVAWWGADGEFHQDGWPECLTDRTTHARFLSVPRAIDEIGRPVLAVDCRQ